MKPRFDQCASGLHAARHGQGIELSLSPHHYCGVGWSVSVALLERRLDGL